MVEKLIAELAEQPAKRELIAQAEALVLRLRGENPDEGDQICEDAAKCIESLIRAQAAHRAEPQGEPVAEVVWHDPRLDTFPDREPHKIIDASLAFFDSAPIGTKLYARPGPRVAELEGALADLLGQVKAFVRQYGEADFETARAVAALGEG